MYVLPTPAARCQRHATRPNTPASPSHIRRLPRRRRAEGAGEACRVRTPSASEESDDTSRAQRRTRHGGSTAQGRVLCAAVCRSVRTYRRAPRRAAECPFVRE
jgi:hypothetical protein